MPAYKTPDVYVEEISTLPPSVAEVATAIPAFIGYTETGYNGSPVITRITNLLEYTESFGGPKPSVFSVTNSDAGSSVERVVASGSTEFLLYYAISHYFKNGGGPCYIVSVGDYTSIPAKKNFEDGLTMLESEDEPTLVILTDAVNLAAADYHELCQKVLDQCNKLRDRFAIFDIKKDAQTGKKDTDVFRDGIGTKYLAYGSAYYPYLQTSLNYDYEETGVTIFDSPASKTLGANSITVSYSGTEPATVKVTVATSATTPDFTVAGHTLTITVGDSVTGEVVASAWTTWKSGHNAGGFEVTQGGDGTGTVSATEVTVGSSYTLDSIRSTNTALYNQVKTLLTNERVVLPPSAAVAGIYASVDRDRGVWKAPANLSVSAVIGPMVKITSEAQEDLNVDATAGKSINAIRAFTGKGTLVWGARTLAGNDNEWRYVSVRRLFIMIEESSRKATSFAVFEPNDMTTWLKVKGMIESFLYSLWERGALAGPTPAAAYFVNVGLGKTMTTQDILEGRMIVEIGVAAVRPAEFIILRFSHKLQQA
jgi:phage tail sheath protein FI